MKPQRILIETVLVMSVSLSGMLFLPQAKTLFALLPLAYLLVERRLRQRSWADLGFKFRTFWKDLLNNWFWFVLVGFVSQAAIVLWARVNFPEYIAHVQSRLPFDDGMGWTILLPLLAISLIGEELTYRTLLQGRLAPFLGSALAILVASLGFGIAHFFPGPAAIVMMDIGLIIVDSILYGIIFARSGNLVVVWLAHWIGDVIGLAMIFFQ